MGMAQPVVPRGRSHPPTTKRTVRNLAEAQVWEAISMMVLDLMDCVGVRQEEGGIG